MREILADFLEKKKKQNMKHLDSTKSLYLEFEIRDDFSGLPGGRLPAREDLCYKVIVENEREF